MKKQTRKKTDKFFQDLRSGNKLLDWIKTCLSGPLVSSKNPFVPGLTLSVAFSRAAKNAPDGERRNLLSLQQTVDNFLLEVLERLPQTVLGCSGRRINCPALFEPVSLEKALNPLQMMIDKREQRLVFCEVSLVMDYLSLQFTRGNVEMTNLATINDQYFSDGSSSDESSSDESSSDEPSCLDGSSSDVSSTVHPRKRRELLHLHHPLGLLQGTDDDFPGLAGIPIVGRCPELQRITAGIAARPDQYYRVPMLRMALDFVVYLAMLAVFSVVLVNTDVDLTFAEIVFIVSFVVVSCAGDDLYKLF